MKKRITQFIAFGFLCFLLGSMQLFAQDKVLFIVGDAGNLNKSDAYIKWLMEEKGYTVTLLSDELSDPAVDPVGQDIIVMSSTVNSGEVADFRWVDKPIAVWEQADLDDFAMTSSQGNSSPEVAAITITELDHPLRTGISPGEIVLTQSGGICRGVPYQSAGIIGLLTDDVSQAAWFVYEKGDSLDPSRSTLEGFPADGLAPEMRICLPFNDPTFESNTPEGTAVLMNTLDYMFDGIVDTMIMVIDLVTYDTLDLQPGQKMDLDVAVHPSNAKDKSLIYTSSDPGVLTVDDNGIVTALAAGSAQITVESTDGGGMATVEIDVIDQGNPSVLFLVGNANLNASDAEIKRMLEATGYIVNVVDDDLCVTDDTLAQDIVLITATVGSGKVVKFTFVDKPVLAWENLVYDDWAMAHGFGAIEGDPSRTMTIDDNTHPLLTGLPVGDIVVCGTDQMAFAYPYPTARVIGKLTQDGRALWFYYEKGDTLDLAQSGKPRFPADSLAPNLIMGLPFNNNNFEQPTPEGTTVLLNSLDYAADGAINSVRPGVAVKFPEFDEMPEILHPGTLEVMPMGFPSNTTDVMMYESLDPGIATFIDGVVTSVDKGTVQIVAHLGVFTDTMEIMVRNPVFVSGVSLDITSATMEVWDDVQLTATVDPANADTATVSWMSSNPDVATVDMNGLVHAVSAGSATITVTTDEGGKTAAAEISVILQDATLAGLVANSGTMDPAFSPEVMAYTLTMPVGSTSAFLIAQASREDAVVTGDGAFNLMSGSATANILVTCPAGNTLTYTINIMVEEEVGISTFDIAGIALYPNPATSMVTLRGVPAHASLRMINSLGQVVLERVIQNQDAQLDLSGLGIGMYLLQVDIDGEKYHSKLIIK